MVVGGMEELLYINTFLAVCLIKIGKVEAILLGNGTFWQMAQRSRKEKIQMTNICPPGIFRIL